MDTTDVTIDTKFPPEFREFKDRKDALNSAVRVYTSYSNLARLQIRGEAPISAKMGDNNKPRKLIASIDIEKNELDSLIAALITARDEIVAG